MPNMIEGQLLAGNERYAIIVSRFNAMVTERLLEGALGTLRRHGGDESRVTIVRAPGSFEIPLLAREAAATRHFAAIICLGAVIQGQTTHHEYINHQVAAGLMQVGLEFQLPVTFGILTCPTMEQALDRAGGKAGNKGDEATLAAIEALNAQRALRALKG